MTWVRPDAASAANPLRVPRAVRLLRRALVALAGLAAAALVLGPAGVSAVARDVLVPAIAAGAATVVVSRALLVRRERAAWTLIALAVALFAAAYVYWSVDLRHQAAPPYPSIADAGWLAFYPIGYVGLGLLVRSRVVRFEMSIWLDGLIGATAVAAVGSAVLLPLVLTGTSGTFAVVATNLAYPLADLLMIGIVALILSTTGYAPGRVWLLIGGGFALIAIADAVYLIELAEGTYHPGTLLDLLWPCGLTAIALSAWEPHRRISAVPLESWRTIAVPSTLALCALGVLVWGQFGTVTAVASLLAAVTIALVVARTGLTFHELRHLAESRRLALTDELTGLGNRRLFFMRTRALLADAREQGSEVALFVLDLDGFKELNDTLGHQSGDAALEQIGVRLSDASPRDAVVARLGGDEFGVAVPVTGRETAAELATVLRAAITERLHVSDVLLQIDASFGIALFPADGGDAETLLRCADVALYQAKERSGSHAFYEAARDSTSRERLYLAQELRAGIAGGELVVHYQPQVDLATGGVGAVEALVRWNHPARGLLAPGHFLPLTERTDLARAVTRAVTEQVARDVAVWRARGLGLRVSVNIGAPDLADEAFAGDLVRMLAQAGLSPQDLVLEVTEGVVMSDRVQAGNVLGELRAAGFDLSLDDFGTGHSSLSRVHELPLAEVKIDRSFVMRMVDEPAARGIVRSVIDLAGNLGLRVVAEGVEDDAALRVLRDLRCDVAQGFHFARALPADELAAWIDARVLGQVTLVPEIARPGSVPAHR